MNEDSFSTRARALEDAFFTQRDAELSEQLRASQERAQTAEELSALSGIDDPKVLRSLVDAGVTGRSLTALRIFPLVAVAWADGIIQENERDKVIQAASKHGLPPSTPAGGLLNQWLLVKPDESIFEAWETYTQALVARMGPEERRILRESLERDMREIATASGGVLGWSAVSRGESDVMQRIRAAFG